MATLKTGAELLLPITSGHDERGAFSTILEGERLRALDFVPCRDFRVTSRRHVVRGMHWQPGLAKLVRCAAGAIVDYVLDLRRASFGAVDVVHLTAYEDAYLYVPPWCAHGYAALVDCEVYYLFNAPMSLDAPRSILWSSIDAAWPFRSPILSARDADAEPISSFEPDVVI